MSHLMAHKRLLSAMAVGVAVYVLLGQTAAEHLLMVHTRLALSMDAGALFFLVRVWVMMTGSTTERIQVRAKRVDATGSAILTLVICGITYSLVIIIMEMHGAKDLPPERLAFHLGLAAVTIVCAWVLTHVLFAIHYAHTYYVGHKGVEFPGERDPDYLDFLYQSLTIGVTGATSDVEITSPKIRHITLVHCVISFFMNMVVLGMTINIVAGLV